MWESGPNSGVVEATHSSRSSINGWWVIWSNEAAIGIVEPSGNVVVVARALKSSIIRKSVIRKFYIQEDSQCFIIYNKYICIPFMRVKRKDRSPWPCIWNRRGPYRGGVQSSGLRKRQQVLFRVWHRSSSRRWIKIEHNVTFHIYRPQGKKVVRFLRMLYKWFRSQIQAHWLSPMKGKRLRKKTNE